MRRLAEHVATLIRGRKSELCPAPLHGFAILEYALSTPCLIKNTHTIASNVGIQGLVNGLFAKIRTRARVIE